MNLKSDSESIAESAESNNSVTSQGRRCKLCRGIGHNQRTCPHRFEHASSGMDVNNLSCSDASVDDVPDIWVKVTLLILSGDNIINVITLI